MQQNVLTIDSLHCQSICDYFSKLNQNDFEGFAALFAPEGSLLPPFESAVVGRDAIRQYLQSTGIEVQASPESSTRELGNDGLTIYQITGKVRNNYFTVNVLWTIDLNADQQITSAKIKLLAPLQELLRFKPR